MGALAMCHQTPLCSLHTYHIGTFLYHWDQIIDAVLMVYFITSYKYCMGTYSDISGDLSFKLGCVQVGHYYVLHQSYSHDQIVEALHQV